MRLVVGYKDETIVTNPPATSKSDSNSVKISSQEKEDIKQTQTHSKPKYHIVQKGETLGKIATKYNVSISALAKYNGITNVNSIKVGQKIKIPQ